MSVYNYVSAHEMHIRTEGDRVYAYEIYDIFMKWDLLDKRDISMHDIDRLAFMIMIYGSTWTHTETKMLCVD